MLKTPAVYLILSSIIIFFSCSKNNNLSTEITKSDTLNLPSIGLSSNALSGKPFDAFYIDITGVKYFNNPGYLYDSINSTISNGDSIMNIWNPQIGSSFYFQWTVYFYAKGNYTLYLKGYKNGKSVASDSLFFKINNDSTDFLKYKWSDSETTATIGYSNPYLKNNIAILKNIKGAIKYINVYNYLQSSLQQTISTQQQLNNLYGLMYKYYGSPQFSDSISHTDVLNNYQNIFSMINNDDIPTAIWKISKSNIVLLKNEERCYIHAEEKK